MLCPQPKKNPPPASTVGAVPKPTPKPSSITASIASTSASPSSSPVESWNICPLRGDLSSRCHERCESHSERVQPHTLISRPRNNELSIAKAASMNSDSANSTYAYLFKQFESGDSVENCHQTHPLGWPVNLSQSIVTRLMVPQAWKCPCISSGVAP